MTERRKLIEVALPLEAINREAAREKAVRQSNPATLHLWWARRPLAACRAVLFASLVDDPSSHREDFPSEDAIRRERARLFAILEDLVILENASNETVLEAARDEIQRSTGGKPPCVIDPFCGGGSIPLEAQRLGLGVHASDLNPVAVLITKALVEIPPRFAGKPPVNPGSRKKLDHSKEWKGVQGLAEDVRHYGKWIRDEAERRIGDLYPKVKLPKGHGGGEATVIAWLWARTVKCPNPACGAQMPLVRSFDLSTKKGREAWIRPLIDRREKSISFGIASEGTRQSGGTVGRRGALCLVCEQGVALDYVRAEGESGRLSVRLMAIAAEGKGGRIYLAPNDPHARAAASARPSDVPETDLPEKALGFRVQAYGMKRHRDLFTARQLVALTTFCDLVSEVRDSVLTDAKRAGLPSGGRSVAEGGNGADAYADALVSYLGLVISNLADLNNALCRWKLDRECPVQLFARQAIPMVWDFPEANPFSESAGSLHSQLTNIGRRLELLYVATSAPPPRVGQLEGTAALTVADTRHRLVVCTDPPYYDNIGYADLSDFFYVWLRRSLGKVWPNLFSTLLTPKKEELIATPFRFGGDTSKAKEFFEAGLGRLFREAKERQHPDYPLTLFYAFKQAEEVTGEQDDERIAPGGALASTGWETMLEGLLTSGFEVRGTWPLRTEMAARSVGQGTNALASSVVLACRPRPASAPLATRKELVAALKKELPEALRGLQQGNIAPVDLAQAAIGPGMAVYSRYSKVIEPNGDRLSVRTALGLINQALDEVLSEQEAEFDADSRWALAWFEQYGTGEGPYGTAETLSKAKDTAISALVEDGILEARKGKVRLLSRDELSGDWDPAGDKRLTVWEVTQHLIRRLLKEGEASAAGLLSRVGGYGETAKDLAYRLFSICDKKGWAQEAGPYNSLVTSWPELVKLAAKPTTGEQQAEMFGA
jgi:putative DNA methylase